MKNRLAFVLSPVAAILFVALYVTHLGDSNALRAADTALHIARNDNWDASVFHRIEIPKGSPSGSRIISREDWRGRLLVAYLQVIADDTPDDAQWGGGATSGLTRLIGNAYSGPDIRLVYASGGSPAVILDGETGNLYWSWSTNSTGKDIHGAFFIQGKYTKP